MFSHQVPKVHIRFSKCSSSSQCVPKEVPNSNSFFLSHIQVWPWLNFHLFYLFHEKHDKAWQNMLLFWGGKHNWASMFGGLPPCSKNIGGRPIKWLFLEKNLKKCGCNPLTNLINRSTKEPMINWKQNAQIIGK